MTQDKALEILKSGKNVFLTGEPGAGKTYTINKFTEWCKQRGKSYAITASTGIAATHINGVTIHSWCGIGINRVVDDNLLDKLIFSRFLSRKVNEADILVIDEVSMLDATMINNIDYILRNVRGKDLPFGNMQVIFVGDFFQLPPVVKDEEVKFAFEAAAWKDAEPLTCYLTEQHRQSDPVFLDLLTGIRTGNIEQKHRDEIIKCFSNDRPDTQLFTHNIDVDRINEQEMRKLTGEEHIYLMTSNVSNPKMSWIVEDLKKQCLSPEKLVLKVGAVVMFTRNRFDEDGNALFVNGTLGTVVDFTETGSPVVELHDGSMIVPARAKWVREEHHVEIASIEQLPLRLAWAITVHKSQGMSLDAASIDLSKTFAYGQGYVALSRVRSLAGLHLQGINNTIFAMAPKVIEQDKIFRAQSEAICN